MSDWEDHRLQDVGERQQRVLEALVRLEPATTPELADGLDTTTDNVRSALYRLADRNLASSRPDAREPRRQVWESDL